MNLRVRLYKGVPQKAPFIAIAPTVMPEPDQQSGGKGLSDDAR